MVAGGADAVVGTAHGFGAGDDGAAAGVGDGIGAEGVAGAAAS